MNLAELHQARSNQLALHPPLPPIRKSLNGSGTNEGWTSIRVQVPSLVIPLSTVAGTLQIHPRERLAQDQAGGLTYSAGEGNRFFLSPGRTWFVFNPNAGAIEVIILDCADPALAAFYGGTRLNGGTADMRAAPPTQLTGAAPAVVTVGIASGVALAADTNRRELYLKNTSTGGQRISLGWSGNPAVLDSGMTFEVGEGREVAVPSPQFSGALEAIASAANAKLSIQAAT